MRKHKKLKKGRRFNWWTDKAALGLFGGFGLAYLVFIPLEAHHIHWLLTAVGGVVGYGIGLFLDAGLPSVVRFVRRGSKRPTLRHPREKQAKKENHRM